MRCLLHSLAVGESIMRVTERCLRVGECFSAFCVCICAVGVCECVFEMHNNIFALPVLPWRQRVATQVTAPKTERARRPKSLKASRKHTLAHNLYTHRELIQLLTRRCLSV